MLPLAHAGHYALWVLYALPVLVVVVAILRSAIAVRREDQEDRRAVRRRRGRSDCPPQAAVLRTKGGAEMNLEGANHATNSC